MIIVGICGASGSGKSTLAKEIEDSLTCTSAIIGLDCYYRDHSDLPFEERVHINYDEPDIFDFDQLYADIQRLQGGLPITRKGYDYARHMRADSDELIQPMDVLILEGLKFVSYLIFISELPQPSSQYPQHLIHSNQILPVRYL